MDEWAHERVEKNLLPYIREPLFFADIVCVRNYALDLQSSSDLLQELWTQHDFLSLIGPQGLFRPEIIEHEFPLCYVALNPNMSAHVYTALKHMNNQYLDRVVTGVSNMCLHNLGGEKNILVASVKKLFPKELHGKIWKAYNKKEWA
jgi:hypothetical protein